MIDPEHMVVSIRRLPLPDDKFAYDDEVANVAEFHGMSLVATYRDWSEHLTFVVLTTERAIYHGTFSVYDVSPDKWLGLLLEELIDQFDGRVVAITVNLGAYSGRLDWNGEMTKMESKYCMTVPTEGQILVSQMHREVETGQSENEGKWINDILDDVTLDAEDKLRDSLRAAQERIQKAR